MDVSQSLLEGVIVMFTIIMFAVLLRRLGIIKKDQSQLFSNIIMKFTLPAVIFSSLAVNSFDRDFLIMAGIMAGIEVGVAILAWLIATVLRFKAGEKGALILVSAFGMTALLGYPIIRQVFPGNSMAIEEAVITSEFGVGLLLFVFGPLIAMYYGSKEIDGRAVISSVKKFFVSPIFVSLIAGILVSFIPVGHDNAVFKTIIHIFSLIGNANLLMVAFTIGLVIEMKSIQQYYLFLGTAILLKLLVKPLLAVWFTDMPCFTEMMKQVVFIETALPSAILTVVFAKHYNCRPDLVSMAIMITLILSSVSVSLLFLAFF